jgi:hypothetical protein
MIQYTPSLMGASALYLATCIIKGNSTLNVWNANLEK